MNKYLKLARRWTAGITGLLLLGSVIGPIAWHHFSARAEDAKAAPAATPVAAEANADTNDDAADKAWKEVYRAAQEPMPPAEWATKPPSREESEKFYLDTLHKGIDLAHDFYTHYPKHPKAEMAQKIEFEMMTIATQQFHDTNLAPRLAVLETKRLSDPNVSEDEKLRLRLEPLQDLVRGLPETADELDKLVHGLQKDFPKRPKVYKVILMVVSHSEGARAEMWAKAITDSPDAPDDVKIQARLELRAMALKKLITGLPGTADELDKSARALPKDFPGRPEAYDLMFYAMQQMDSSHASALAKEINDSDAPAEVKTRLKMLTRILALQKLMAGFPGTTDEFMKGVHDFEKDYPDNQNSYNLLLMALDKSEGEQAKKIGNELLAAPLQENTKMEVEQTLKHNEYVGKPLDIQYTALDGRQVDIAKLKGKVVLVDFWGTWCGVCMHELPKVRATYLKLHDKGFEIVGIDCNDEKASVQRVVKASDIPWPQYFEDAQENKFAAQYSVHIFPTMWLVDKKGILRYINARDDLEGKTAKLLAE